MTLFLGRREYNNRFYVTLIFLWYFTKGLYEITKSEYNQIEEYLLDRKATS
jgi:hypothetical protein